MFYKYNELLNQRGLTSYRVSKETGIPYATLSDWKNGKSTPKIDKLIIIANYLKVPVSIFVELEESKDEN